jgi:DNA-directed RNA polymerase specialized sigma24 family protein
MDALDDAHAKGSSSHPFAPVAGRKWSLTQEAFDSLLSHLDPDRETAGRKYLEVRSNLIRFFEWRGCPFPEDHTDETINRVARRASEGEEIRNPTAYLLGAARMIVLEIYKEQAKEHQALSELAYTEQSYQFEELEPRVECLERCLGTLSSENRELILQYYRGEKGGQIKIRKSLSERLSVPLNTLRMRALRMRENLLVCVQDCLKK